MTTRDDGGASERIAPVIPLFGAARSESDSAPDSRGRSDDHTRADEAEHVVPRRTGDAGLWRSTWDDVPARSTGSRISPTREGSFGVADPEQRTAPSDRHPARGGARGGAPRLRALQNAQDEGDGTTAAADVRAIAEEILVRKLRSRSLSVSEARLILRGFDHDGVRLDANVVDDVLDAFSRRGYLDDAQLAGQLVAAGIERKGQGRVALSRALAQRGIPREVIDAALDELPDDDAERALEYARSKARSLTRLDSDTALRRLVGQLARRGYNGGIAMSAAKTALAEATFGRPTSGVRFVDSD